MRKIDYLRLFLFLSFFCIDVHADNPAGADTALALTQDVALVTGTGIVLDETSKQMTEAELKSITQSGKLTIEREGYVTDFRDQPTNCPEQAQPSNSTPAKKVPLRLDIELRTFVVGGFSRNGTRTAYEDATFDPLWSSFTSYPSVRNRISGKSLTDAHRELMNKGLYTGTPIDPRLSDDVFDAILRDRLINANASDRAAILAEAGSAMSFDRQIAFVAKLGGEFSANYDTARSDQAISATAIPSCDDMFTALGTGRDIGVCRDIHMCMANVLKKMGNEGNVYGISYATPGNYHVSLVATDPKNPNRIHNINYSEKNVSDDRSGVAALAQDHSIPDVGLTYRLWKPDGNGGGTMVASLPSQMGLLLNEVTGGVNTRDMDPTIRQDYSLVAAGGGVGPWYGRVFAANLANGDRVLGVATHVSWGNRPENNGDVFNGLAQEGSIGLAFAHRIMDRPNGDVMTQMDTNSLYLNFQQRVSAPIQATQNISLEPTAGIHIFGAGIEGGMPDDRGWTGDGDLRMNLSLRATYLSDSRATRISAEGGTQVTLGLEDIRGLLGSDVIPVVNHSYLQLDAEHLVSPDIRLNARMLYVFREYGDTFTSSVGASFDSRAGRTGVNLGFLTPVGQANGFQPGGAHPAITVGLSHSILTDDRNRSILDINTTYTQNLDDGNYMFNTGAALHF